MKKNRLEKQVKTLEKASAVETTKSVMTHEEQKELKRVEKEIEKLEAKKSEITAKFDNTSISPDEIARLSKELSGISDEIEVREMRWMELVDKAS